MTPSSLSEAMTAQKMTRTAVMAWRAAFHGCSLPVALADALDALTHVGEQITGAAIAAQVRAVALASPHASGQGQKARNEGQTDVDGSEVETGLVVVRRGLESNRGEGVKEQLERLFPRAVVKVGGLWAAVQQGAVTIEIIKPGSVIHHFTVTVFSGPSSSQMVRVEGSGVESCLAFARDRLLQRSAMAPTATERTQALRAFRVLEAANIDPRSGAARKGLESNGGEA